MDGDNVHTGEKAKDELKAGVEGTDSNDPLQSAEDVWKRGLERWYAAVNRSAMPKVPLDVKTEAKLEVGLFESAVMAMGEYLEDEVNFDEDALRVAIEIYKRLSERVERARDRGILIRITKEDGEDVGDDDN